MRTTEAVIQTLDQFFNPVALILLLGGDVALIILHVTNRLFDLSNYLLELTAEGGYPEVFQYIKEYWIASVLFAMGWRMREGIYGVWALFFTYILCDDALGIHETLGWTVADQLHFVPMLGLRAKDFGEITVSVVAGGVFFALIALFYRRCSNDARNVSKDLAVMLGVLAFFGIFIDMVHIAVTGLPVRGLTIVEDGGEMLTMSTMSAYIIHLAERKGHVPQSLWQHARSVLASRTT